MNPSEIIPVLLSAAVIVVYLGFVIAAMISIWRTRRLLWWMPMAWSAVVLIAPILGAAAWFLIGENVNHRTRHALRN